MASKCQHKVQYTEPKHNPGHVETCFPNLQSNEEVELRDEIQEPKRGKAIVGLCVVHLIQYTPPTDDSWKCTSIFYTYMKCKNKT